MVDRARWLRWVVAAYDRGYRRLHGLDRPDAQAGPVLRVERRRLRRALALADGTRLRRGARIGVLHLDNARVLALHRDGRPSHAIGFEFRRLVLISLRSIAGQVAADGPLAPLQAYSATTLFHRRMPRLGFTPAVSERRAWARLVSAYERALLHYLHPAARRRAEARRLWISRERLIALYGRERVVFHDVRACGE